MCLPVQASNGWWAGSHHERFAECACCVDLMFLLTPCVCRLISGKQEATLRLRVTDMTDWLIRNLILVACPLEGWRIQDTPTLGVRKYPGWEAGFGYMILPLISLRCECLRAHHHMITDGSIYTPSSFSIRAVVYPPLSVLSRFYPWNIKPCPLGLSLVASHTFLLFVLFVDRFKSLFVYSITTLR